MQYTIEEHLLTMQVKPAPILLRGILYITGTLLILGGMFFIVFGRSSMFVALLLCFLFLLGGVFLFKLALWNTFGKEKVYFFSNSVQYRAYYGWYKGKLKMYNLVPNKEFQYTIVNRGYTEDAKGVLQITTGSGVLTCATLLPIEDLERLIVEIQGVHV